MKALTLHPKQANSLDWREVPEPSPDEGDLLCETLAIGVCGTDFELFRGDYGAAPPKNEWLIIGHESLGRVQQAPPNSAFKAGDLVVGFVRFPDPLPCRHCAVGEWDLCENDQYTERGISGRNGFASERFRVKSEHALRVESKLGLLATLIEPTSVVAKAWEYADRIGQRSAVPAQSVLIIGGGPVGQLAALLGRQRNLQVHLFDHHETGPKPELIRALGGTYHSTLSSLEATQLRFDFTFECTGKGELLSELFSHSSPDGILCLLGLSPGQQKETLNLGKLNQDLVLHNEVIFGSVNANRRHYEKAQQSLLSADPAWLEKMITRKIPFPRWREAFEKNPNDVKVLLLPENAATRPSPQASHP